MYNNSTNNSNVVNYSNNYEDNSSSPSSESSGDSPSNSIYSSPSPPSLLPTPLPARDALNPTANTFQIEPSTAGTFQIEPNPALAHATREDIDAAVFSTGLKRRGTLADIY